MNFFLANFFLKLCHFWQVCPTEILAFSDRIEEFQKINAEVIAASVDSHFTHLAWIKTPRKQGGLGEINIPLISDLSHEISKAYGETRIKLSTKENIKILNHIDVLAPKIIEIADINEVLEGSFVQVSGEITEIKGSYMYVDDGSEEVKVYAKKGTNIDKRNFKIADLVTITGIVGKTTGGYQILPRSQNDIIKTGVSEFSAEYENSNQETLSESGVMEKYLTATAGGLTSVIVGLFAHSKRRHFGNLFIKLARIVKK